MREKSRKLNLKREVLADLTPGELRSVAGANLSDACINYTKICATVDHCITDYCTYTCFYTFACHQ